MDRHDARGVGLSFEELTPVIWIARAGPEHRRYGDPYSAAAVCRRRGLEVEVMAAAGDWDFRSLRKLTGRIRARGYRVTWERRRGNSARRVSFEGRHDR